jgi:N-formylglutamate amidohydrolase
MQRKIISLFLYIGLTTISSCTLPRLAPCLWRQGVAEVQHRIERYWQPYHDALWSAAHDLHRRFGALWHLDVHAMTDDSYALLRLPDRELADFVRARAQSVYRQLPR